MERNGILIDACPNCRGIWLYRGELDKLIELEAGQNENFIAEMRGNPWDEQRARGHHGGEEKQGRHGGYGKSGRKKRAGLFGDIFDIG